MNEHYFSEKPKSRLKTKTVCLNLRGYNVELVLASGTFASRHIDMGSKIFANYIEVNENDSVLDLGCGNGIIGIIAAKLTSNEVILTDINKRAAGIAMQNTSSFKNITVLQGNLYEPIKDKKFDAILINLPSHAGREICDKMIVQAKDYLNPKGTLQIIEKHNRGGKHFEDLMKSTFGNLDILAKSGGYWVCSSKNE